MENMDRLMIVFAMCCVIAGGILFFCVFADSQVHYTIGSADLDNLKADCYAQGMIDGRGSVLHERDMTPDVPMGVPRGYTSNRTPQWRAYADCIAYDKCPQLVERQNPDIRKYAGEAGYTYSQRTEFIGNGSPGNCFVILRINSRAGSTIEDYDRCDLL